MKMKSFTVIAALTAIVTVIALTTCASGGSSGGSSRSSKPLGYSEVNINGSLLFDGKFQIKDRNEKILASGVLGKNTRVDKTPMGNYVVPRDDEKKITLKTPNGEGFFLELTTQREHRVMPGHRPDIIDVTQIFELPELNDVRIEMGVKTKSLGTPDDGVFLAIRSMGKIRTERVDTTDNTESSLKAAFNELDPVLQKNLKPNAAIAVFPVITDDPDYSEFIRENILVNIVNSGKYTVIEKTRIDRLLDEHDFQRSGLVSDETMISFGKLLEADAVILSSITGFGNDFNLIMIAVDMSTRATLAIAKKPVNPRIVVPEKNLFSIDYSLPVEMRSSVGIAKILLLPAFGGSNGDNLTLGSFIASLRDINRACTLTDKSANVDLLPVNFTGTTPDDFALLHKLACEYKANFIFFPKIQIFGQRYLVTINRYNTYAKYIDSVVYLDYADPIEAWIKLPGAVTALMKMSKESEYAVRDTTDAGSEYYIWVKYREGVDRAFAEQMINIFTGDYTAVELDSIRYKNRRKTIINWTSEFEAALARQQGVTEKARNKTEIPNRDWNAAVERYITEIKSPQYKNANGDVLSHLLQDTNIVRPSATASDAFFIEVSSQGNRTRFNLIAYYPGSTSFSILGARETPEYYLNVSLVCTDVRDFIRQVRGLSLSYSNEKPTAGYDLGIDANVKYNYWNYAGEDSFIPDLVTITQVPPQFPDESKQNGNQLRFNNRRGWLHKIYYAAEDDFSKAVELDLRKDGTVSAQMVQGVTERPWTAFTPRKDFLKPNVTYYFWATFCWGNLDWLATRPIGPIEFAVK